MIRKRIKITLKSDLCVGSGYSYAGIVDGDVCYDDCGIPYIPAKRLKGCLREAAEFIGFTESEIKDIFGDGGQEAYASGNTLRGLVIHNAYIPNYEEIYGEIKTMNTSMKKYISPQNVLEQFTTIKAQTKINENGVAEDKALRFIRAVKQYSPMEKDQELVFFAEIEVSEENKDKVEMVVKALRNLGMNRNRGLGSVKSDLVDSAKEDLWEVEGDEIKEDATYVLKYVVKNVAPLVLNVDNEYSTEKYISGQNVLGFLAASYLKANAGAEDAMFCELFLKKNVIYSGLFPYDGDTYYPAPAYVNRLKKTKKYVNVSKKIPLTESECEVNGVDKAYASGNGNQPKKLKGMFVCVDENGIRVKEVSSDVVYHHTKKSKKQDSLDGELLYSFETIREQQLFSGQIVGKGKYLSEIIKLMQQGKMRFGKSKTAQYGACVLEGKGKIELLNTEPIVYKKGSRILVTLQSDGVFLNENGYTIVQDDVRNAIKETLGICEPDGEDVYSELEVRKLVGFYGKWNLKRQSIPVVRAGSTFEYVLEEDLSVTTDAFYVGERNNEGYGQICICRNNDENFCVEYRTTENKESVDPEKAKELCKKILIGKMREALNNAALREEAPIKNPSTIGRVVLMLAESVNAYPDDAMKAYEDFSVRIESIKDREKHDDIKRLRNKLVCDEGTMVFGKTKYVKHINSLLTVARDLYKGQESELENEVMKMWNDYFMRVLTQEKYRQKGR